MRTAYESSILVFRDFKATLKSVIFPCLAVKK